MRLTNFKRLSNAVHRLDMHFTRTMIETIITKLDGKGQPFNVEDFAITEEAIYYIHPESGLATKVTLYEAEQESSLHALGLTTLDGATLDHPEVYEEFHSYHVLKCNILAFARNHGWKGSNFRAIKRKDGFFPYRLTVKEAGPKRQDAIVNLDQQKLNVCPNCLTKLNSILGEEANYTQSDFSIRSFFDAGFEARWQRRLGYSRTRGSLTDIYPGDWEEISSKRMEQAQYICEGCNHDFSAPELRRFLTIHHIDHLYDKVSFVHLQCLCLGCCAQESGREELKGTQTYKEYLIQRKNEST